MNESNLTPLPTTNFEARELFPFAPVGEGEGAPDVALSDEFPCPAEGTSWSKAVRLTG